VNVAVPRGLYAAIFFIRALRRDTASTRRQPAHEDMRKIEYRAASKHATRRQRRCRCYVLAHDSAIPRRDVYVDITRNIYEQPRGTPTVHVTMIAHAMINALSRNVHPRY